MSDDRTIRVRLLAEVQSYLQGMKQAAGATVDFGKQVSGQGTATKKSMESVGRGALLMSAGLTVALGASIKAAIDWESAWAGVTKTVSGSADEMGELEDGLRGLARTLPASHKEIAGVAEAAGQLGIQRSAIVGFTETMIALGVSTNLSSDQAATGIAQIANVMGTAQSDIDRFGATLVALGNVGASTESDILEMAKRLSGAGALVGATESDVLALANAMASMGIEAQLGGGAFSRVMLKIFTAVKSGGEKLENFADVAGMSAAEFTAAFEADPIRAIDSLIKGLDDIDHSGGNVVARLSELGFKGTQDLQVLLRLKGAGDLLTDSLELGSKAWLENTALTNEANKRYETTASKLKILRNQVVDVAIETGGVFLPAIKGATDVLGTMVAGLGQLDGAGGTAVAGLGALAAGVTGLIGVVGVFGPKVAAFKAGLMDMGTAGQFAGRNLGTIATGLGVVGVALAAYTYVVGEAAREQAEAERRTKGFADAITEAGSEIDGTRSAMLDMVTDNADLAHFLADTGSSVDDLADALTGSDAEFSAFLENTRVAGELAGMSGEELDGAAWALSKLRGEQAQGVADAEALGEATDESTSASQRAKKALDNQAAAAKEVTDAIKDMIDANHAAIDPLFGLLDAAQGNRDAQKELAQAMADGTKTAEEIQTAHENAAKSALEMDGAALQLAGGIAAGTVNLDIAKASLDTWVAQGLISKDTAIEMARQFDAAAIKADELAGERITTLTLDDQASPGLDALITKLRGIKSLSVTIGSFGRPIINPATDSRWGNVLSYAGGGVTPAHITRREILRYGEPATGGEAMVPRLGNRSRSMGVLNTAAGWYGAAVVPAGSMFTGGRDAPGRAVAASQSGPLTIDATFMVPVKIGDREIMHVIKKRVHVEGSIEKALGR